MVIIVTHMGIPVGYVKSVSRTKNTFKMTPNKLEAKRYSTEDRVHSDIDFLTMAGYPQGYVFFYE